MALERMGWQVARWAYAPLARRRLVRAAQNGVVRLLSKTRLTARARLVSGDALYVDLASRVGRSIWLHGEYDVPLVDFLLGDLREGDVFLDVGANVGYYTAVAARKVGATGLVVAIEPSPLALSLLARSLAENRWPNVVLCSIAATSAPSIVRFDPLADSGLSRIAPSGGLAVAAARLDDAVLPLLDGRRLAGLKIDVEGHEIEALRGMERIFREVPPRRALAEALPEQGRARREALFAFFTDRGYAAVDPLSSRPVGGPDVDAGLWNVGFVAGGPP